MRKQSENVTHSSQYQILNGETVLKTAAIRVLEHSGYDQKEKSGLAKTENVFNENQAKTWPKN